MIRVVAPCRLHFGLFHVPTDKPPGCTVRRFGGVGLSVVAPHVTVTARPSNADSASGPLAERALGFLRQVREHVVDLGHFALATDGPPEHVGLGVGTALGLAVARAVVPGPRAAADLAPLVGRGRRSGIGTHGFDRGGFIVDDGKEADEELPRIGERVPFPSAWRVVLLRPAVRAAWYGHRERAAFGRRRSPEAAVATAERLRALAYGTLVPAVREADFTTFVAAVREFNRLAGEPFVEDQGGPYTDPAVERLVNAVRGWGTEGAGQTSWGPTVFAFAPGHREAAALMARVRDAFPDLEDVTVTTADNDGAVVTRA